MPVYNYTTLDAGPFTAVFGINGSGQIVGTSLNAATGNRGFLYSNGTFTSLNDPLASNGTVANAINDAGQIVEVKLLTVAARLCTAIRATEPRFRARRLSLARPLDLRSEDLVPRNSLGLFGLRCLEPCQFTPVVSVETRPNKKKWPRCAQAQGWDVGDLGERAHVAPELRKHDNLCCWV
jgi:probable HAF family extracellular repeat protein